MEDMMFEIKPQPIMLLKQPTGTVSVAGVKAVQRMLWDMMPDWDELDNDTRAIVGPRWTFRDKVDDAVEDIDPYTWLVRKGKYAGTFPKRLAKSVKDKIGIKLDPAQLGRLGQLAKSHSMEETDYHVDIVSEIDWQDGDFGDRGSCFWGSNREAKEMIESIGGLAVRFYEYEDQNRGYARAWCLPYEHSTWVIFNGYGIQNVTVAHLLADSAGLSYKRVTVDNNGSCDNMLWINGGTGYIIGEQSIIDRIDHVDFGIDDDATRCDNCGERTGTDYYTVGWSTYCEYCYNELFAYCEKCDTDVDRDLIREAPDGRYMCENCLNRAIAHGEFATCDACERVLDNQDCVYETVDGEEVCMCEDCFSELVTTCEKCDGYTEGQFHSITTVPSYISRTMIRTHILCIDCWKETRNEQEEKS
jgi:hypothetical protein